MPKEFLTLATPKHLKRRGIILPLSLHSDKDFPGTIFCYTLGGKLSRVEDAATIKRDFVKA